ncbi:MAG: hypothetical protein EXR73_06235 [Myxococcales bacterium]|nr:hypothetical protein [Myxococcales bacterium]
MRVSPKPKLLAALLAVASFTVASLARAQVPADEPTPVPAAPTPAATADLAFDPPALDAQLEAGLSALVAGEWAEATRLLEEVAAHSNLVQRRIVVGALALRARAELAKATLSGPVDPTSPAASVNKDDTQEGRSLLLGVSTLMGLAFYAPMAVFITDPSSAKGRVATYMLTAGGSFFVPYLATRNTQTSWAQASLGIYGTTRGVLHGFLLDLALDLDPSTDRLATSMIVGASVAEGLGGYLLARDPAFTAGRANLIGAGGDVGMLAGLLGSFAIFGDKVEDHRRLVPGLVLATGAAGMLAGNEWSRHRTHSFGDAEVHRTAAFFGAWAGATPWVWADGVDPDVRAQLASLTALAGMAGGTVLADKLVAGKDLSAGQGFLLQLGTIGGTLIGGGVGWILSPGDGDTTLKLVTTMSVLGGLGGFATIWQTMDARPEGTHAKGASTATLVPLIGPDTRGLAVTGSF